MAEVHDMNAILRAPDKGISQTRGVGGLLARLFRRLLLSQGILPASFESFASDFVLAASRKVSRSDASRLFTKGNLRRELAKPTMSFKVFIKALKLLKVQRVTVGIHVQFSNGKLAYEEASLDLGDQEINAELLQKDSHADS